MADTGNTASDVSIARVRKSRDADIPLGDVAVGYSYIEAKFGRGFGRVSVWRKVREGRFPASDGDGTWRKSRVDQHFDELYPLSDNT